MTTQDTIEDVPFIGECHFCGRGSEASLSGPFVVVVHNGYRFRYHQQCADLVRERNRPQHDHDAHQTAAHEYFPVT